MGSTSSGFRWSYDQIRPSLKSAEQKAKSYLSRITTFHALRAETYARLNAPWTDRTGNARSGLTAEADNSGSGNLHYEINIYHKMPYGIWLEVRWSGRYAIIVPTVRHEAPLYWQSAEEVLDRMFGSG
jgi:hypothetical protein